MKRFFDFWKNDDAVEKIIGGIFGAIAIVAILIEMKLGNYETEAIVAGIKDISGTLITVVMLVVAINALKPKKAKLKGFTEVFASEMEELIKKYTPMITFFGIESTQKISDAYRYNIANKLDCVATNTPGGNNKLFRIKEGMKTVEFSVSATIFGDKHQEIAAKIAPKIKICHQEMVDDYKLTNEGFALELNAPLSGGEEAVEMAKIIDHILMLYLAEYNSKR